MIKTGRFNEKELISFVSEMMKEWKVPGLALSIVKDDKIFFKEGFGFKDIKKKEKVNPETMFEIASCTKAFTTMAMALLADEDKIEWDKPVREYIPEFKLYDKIASEKITPRDLVCHRSGLPRYDWVWYRRNASRGEIIKSLHHLEPNKDFRSFYQYNNLMFMVAGYLIERITGKTWEDFVSEKILKPLGISQCIFSVDDMAKSQNYAKPYMLKKGKVKEIDLVNFDLVSSAGSIITNIIELAKWVGLHLNKGKLNGKTFVSEKNVKEMHSPQMISQNTFEYDEIINPCYCLGWNLFSYRGTKLYRHGGSLDGYSSCVSFMPGINTGIAVLTNMESTDAHNAIAYYIYDKMLGLNSVDWSGRFKAERDKDKKEMLKERKLSKLSRKKDTKPTHDFKDFCGEYIHPAYGKIKIELQKSKPFLIFNNYTFPMKHYHYNIFEFTDELWDNIRKVFFHLDKKGNIEKLGIKFEPNADDIIFKKQN